MRAKSESRRGVDGGFQVPALGLWGRGVGTTCRFKRAARVLVRAGSCGSAPHPDGMTDEPSSMTGVRVTLVIAEIVGVSHGP